MKIEIDIDESDPRIQRIARKLARRWFLADSPSIIPSASGKDITLGLSIEDDISNQTIFKAVSLNRCVRRWGIGWDKEEAIQVEQVFRSLADYALWMSKKQ